MPSSGGKMSSPSGVQKGGRGAPSSRLAWSHLSIQASKRWITADASGWGSRHAPRVRKIRGVDFSSALNTRCWMRSARLFFGLAGEHPVVRHGARPVVELVNVQPRCVDRACHISHQVAGRYADKHEVPRIGNTRNQHVQLPLRKDALDNLPRHTLAPKVTSMIKLPPGSR